MNTSGQRNSQDSPGLARERTGARADLLDVILLIVAVLLLAGGAAVIVIGFPQALEIVAVQANAAVAPPADAQAAERREQSADEDQDENEPFFADDIRTEGILHAGAASPGPEVDSAREAPVVSR